MRFLLLAGAVACVLAGSIAGLTAIQVLEGSDVAWWEVTGVFVGSAGTMYTAAAVLLAGYTVAEALRRGDRQLVVLPSGTGSAPVPPYPVAVSPGVDAATGPAPPPVAGAPAGVPPLPRRPRDPWAG